jgi:hypothetical protein
MKLANLHSCDDMGICLMRTPPCRQECTVGAPREMLPRIDLDDADPVLRAEGCMRMVWMAVCCVIGVLMMCGVLTLLWRHDAALRAALVSVWDALVAMYWASLASMY